MRTIVAHLTEISSLEAMAISPFAMMIGTRLERQMNQINTVKIRMRMKVARAEHMSDSPSDCFQQSRMRTKTKGHL